MYMYGLLKDGIAETPVFMKDTVSYVTGEWKYMYLELFLFFINFSTHWPISVVFCMRLVVKKWIPQYRVTVVKNNEICGFVRSRKRNDLVAWQASLKQGGSSGVCERAVVSSQSSASQRSAPFVHKGTVWKLTTGHRSVSGAWWLHGLHGMYSWAWELSNKWSVRQFHLF